MEDGDGDGDGMGLEGGGKRPKTKIGYYPAYVGLRFSLWVDGWMGFWCSALDVATVQYKDEASGPVLNSASSAYGLN